MESLTDHILNAFLAQWDRIRADPDELHARLQRRNRTMLQRPPRAWCIALHAGDTRITALNTVIEDCHAIDERRPHTVSIDKPLVRRLCAPVYIEPPGELWTDVAARLGVHEESLRYAMNRGHFHVHHVPPFGRRGFGRGKPVPLIYRPGAINPCAESFRAPDPAWGSLWRYHGDAAPDDLNQPLRRLPRLRPYRGQMRFRGWDWLCPACGRRVETIYLPLAVPTVEAYLRLTLGDPEADAPPQPAQTFACVRCHHVRYLTRTDDNGWNELVAYLTCGLLYGSEVERPADWFERRRAYRRAQRRKPAITAG